MHLVHLQAFLSNNALVLMTIFDSLLDTLTGTAHMLIASETAKVELDFRIQG